MALSSGFDSNLALTLLGGSITAGLAYGGYAVFKNKETPATQLLQMRKRVPLDKDGDVDLWKASWKKYVEKHTKTVPIEAPAQVPPTPKGAAKAPTTKKEIATEDQWKLNDWTEKSQKVTEVPESFKNTCENKNSEKYFGTWDQKYQDFETFCTKEAEQE